MSNPKKYKISRLFTAHAVQWKEVIVLLKAQGNATLRIHNLNTKLRGPNVGPAFQAAAWQFHRWMILQDGEALPPGIPDNLQFPESRCIKFIAFLELIGTLMPWALLSPYSCSLIMIWRYCTKVCVWKDVVTELWNTTKA